MATGRVGNIQSLGVTIEAAFGYDPDDTSPVWTDISTYVMGFSTRRGRKREIDRVTAGSCLIRLDNADRRFEGGYTGGAYGSNVVPMVPIRITTTRNAVTYPVFYGFADEWVPSFDPSQPRAAFVDLRATDAFKALAKVPLPESVWAYEVAADSPTAWYRLAEKTGDQLIDASGNGIDGVYVGQRDTTRSILPYGSEDTAQLATDGAWYAQIDNLAVVPTAAPFSIELWLRADINYVPSANILLKGGDGSSTVWFQIEYPGPLIFLYRYGENGEVDYEDGATDVLTAGAVKHVLFVLPSGGPGEIYVDGVLRSGSETALGVQAPFYGLTLNKFNTGNPGHFEGVFDELVIYDGLDLGSDASSRYAAGAAPWDGDLTGARFARILDLAGWPAGLRDIDTGVSTLGPASLNRRPAIDLLWELVEYESGSMYVARDGDITFVDSAARWVDTTSTVSQATYSYTGSNSKSSGVTFDYSDELLTNHAVITTAAGVVYEAEDSTSIGRYLRRTVQQRIPHTDTNHAQGLADWRVYTGKDPQRRITSLVVPTARDTTTFDATVALELGYRVTVTLDPPGTGTISEALYVEGIDHNVTPHNWTTTLWCSPVPSPAVFVIGTDSIGGTAIIGY
jgi:hypothetical protein